MIQLLETFDIATSIEYQGRKTILIPEFQQQQTTVNWPRCKDTGYFEIQRWISCDCKLPHGLLKRVQVRILKKVYKRSGANEFNLAQKEIYILDKNSTQLYCLCEEGTKEYPGFGISEGIRLLIRGKDKHHVMSLLSKVYPCINDTLNDFPSLVFDHHIIHTSPDAQVIKVYKKIARVK